MSTIRRALVICLTTVLAMLAMIPAIAQAAPGPDLPGIDALVDGVVSRQLHDGDVPGAAVTVVAGGRVVLSRGYGVADVDAGTPVDPAMTGFYSASTAKLFTAAAVLQLVDAGKLDLHADVNRYLTTFQVPDTFPGRPVTLDNLLTHTSGFDPDYGALGTSAVSPEQLPSLGDSLAAKLPRRIWAPGTVMAYDNYGVALAGYLVEQASGMPYADYVDTHVLAPLGMTGSTASQPHPAPIDEHLATGYRPGAHGQVATAGNASPWSPTGPGQVITAADMGRFMIDQLTAGESALGADVPQRLQEQHYAQHADKPGVGYIYEERPRNGHRTLFKGGDGSGFHNDMVLLPEYGVGIFLTVNGDGNGRFDGGALADAVIDTYFPAGPFTAPQAVADGRTPGYAGTYQTSRVSRDSIMAVRAFAQSLVEVTGNTDGTVTTAGRTLSTHDGAKTQKWVPLSGGRFQEIDGLGTIAFDDHGVLTESRSQNQVYLKLAWYESPTLHRDLLLAALAGLLLALLGLPFVALVRRLRGRPRTSGGARAARVLAWAVAALDIAVVGALLVLLSDQNAASEQLSLGAPLVYALMAAASVAALGGLALVVAVVLAWARGWWTATGRTAYTLTVACAVTCSVVLFAYNVAGLTFD